MKLKLIVPKSKKTVVLTIDNLLLKASDKSRKASFEISTPNGTCFGLILSDKNEYDAFCKNCNLIMEKYIANEAFVELEFKNAELHESLRLVE